MYKPPGGLYSEGRFNGGFFELQFWGAYIWKGLYMEGLIFGILRYFQTEGGCVPVSFFYVINNMRVAESERRHLNLKNPQVWC